MPITTKTVYTKERMLKFHYTILRSKKVLWVTMAVCTLLVLGLTALLALMGDLDRFVLLCTGLVLVLDATYLIAGLLLPRFTIAKSKQLNTELTYTFEDDHFQVDAASAYAKETATIRYAMLSKVQKRDSELYLMINNRQGYIVDLADVPADTQAQLKQTLTAAIPSSLIRW